MKMNMQERSKLSIDELQHSFAEWALSKSNDKHAKFRSEAVGQMLSYLNAASRDGLNNSKSDIKNVFPKDLTDAYEHVLRHDDMPDYVIKYSDKLDKKGFLEPFLRWYDKNNKSKVIDYKIKPEYKGHSKDDLDPLERFTFEEVSKEEAFFKEWFIIDDDNDASHLGLFFEACLTCYALQHAQCFSCKYRKSLRWNGGGNTSWQDLVCISCNSTYEVKTKANMVQVEKAFKYNNIPGGSFSNWCLLDNGNKQPAPDRKRFLVMLPRAPTFSRQLKKVYPVQIAEISTILPALYPASFNPNKPIRFKSKISVKLNTRAKWFDLPSTGEKVECWNIAEKVFVERFSQETFDSLTRDYFISDGNGIESNNEGNSEAVEEDTSSIGIDKEAVEKVGNLSIVPDHWEELDSDDE